MVITRREPPLPSWTFSQPTKPIQWSISSKTAFSGQTTMTLARATQPRAAAQGRAQQVVPLESVARDRGAQVRGCTLRKTATTWTTALVISEAGHVAVAEEVVISLTATGAAPELVVKAESMLEVVLLWVQLQTMIFHQVDKGRWGQLVIEAKVTAQISKFSLTFFLLFYGTCLHKCAQFLSSPPLIWNKYTMKGRSSLSCNKIHFASPSFPKAPSSFTRRKKDGVSDSRPLSLNTTFLLMKDYFKISNSWKKISNYFFHSFKLWTLDF